VVEAYPVDPKRRHSSNMLWNGTPGLFGAAGFTEVCKLGRERWVFKKTLKGNTAGTHHSQQQLSHRHRAWRRECSEWKVHHRSFLREECS
jgi:hypothetical protein